MTCGLCGIDREWWWCEQTGMKRFLFGFAALSLMALPCSFAEENASAAELRKIPDKLVVLTFDDCNKSDRAFVAGEVKKHGFGATFYVTEGLGFLRNKDHYVTWEEIAELHGMGFEIGNHTRTHPHLPRLSIERMKGELSHIEKRCAQYKIPRPVTFCYPGFGHSPACVEVLTEMKYLFARRGVGPEFKDGGKGARGPAYDPRVDHPLLVPTTGYAGPDWKFEDLVWAVEQARDGRIAVLCYHGVPALEHPWVNCDPGAFRKHMAYLRKEGCTVIAMRDLVHYVDPAKGPGDPYAPIRARVAGKK